MDTFHRSERDTWRQRVKELLTEAGIDVIQLAGGSFRILTANNLLMASDLAQFKPSEIANLLATQARYERASA